MLIDTVVNPCPVGVLFFFVGQSIGGSRTRICTPYGCSALGACRSLIDRTRGSTYAAEEGVYGVMCRVDTVHQENECSASEYATKELLIVLLDAVLELTFGLFYI